MKKTIAFLGAGALAEAFISGMLQSNLYQKDEIVVTNHSDNERLQYLETTYGITTTRDLPSLIEDSAIIILMMKPKDVYQGLLSIKEYVSTEQLIISAVAGVSTASISYLLDCDIPIVRTMPNTSATIRKSATAIAPSQHATMTHIRLAQQLLETIGIVKTVAEEQMDAVTGLSGSGPAYVYYLVEAMGKAATEVGLSSETSHELILQTIIGAAEMLLHTKKPASILRKEVTSQGGTTAAGIATLEEYQYEEAMIECIIAATKRANELGEEMKERIYE